MRFTGKNSAKLLTKAVGVSLFFPLTCLSADFDLVVNADGLVSMSGQNISVEEVMTTLGSELNIAISFPAPVPDTVTVDFQDLKLEQAIQQVTRSYILVTSKNAPHKGIKEIIVMPEGESSAYLPEEGELKELLVQDGGKTALSPINDNEFKVNKLRMLERIAEIKKRTQVDVEEARLAIELEEEMGEGIPTPLEMD